jgi:hypothetical protein
MRKRAIVALVGTVALAAPAAAEAVPAPADPPPPLTRLQQEYQLHKHIMLVQIERRRAQWRMHLKVLYWRARHRRIVKAQKAAAAAAAAATTIAPSTPTVSSSGFPASCVAMAEEGGSNSVAGYFGTIYSPSSYSQAAFGVGTYGESWLNWPYSAQLQVAEAIYADYGQSAWGPLTQSKCW